MSEKFSKRLRSSLPPWALEKRRPTRAELAAKHFADGGGMGETASASSIGWPDEETPTPVKIRKFNT